MWGATAKRWRDRLELSDFWFGTWLCLLAGLSLWFAWGHQLLLAIWLAALGVASATRRDR